jgi:hypothetical protein
MNTMRLLTMLTRIGTILGNDFPANLPKGDAGLYVLARVFVEKLEASNPGLPQAVGYEPITTAR